jgi:hypothetical protein
VKIYSALILAAVFLISCTPITDYNPLPADDSNTTEKTEGKPGDFNGQWHGNSVFRNDENVYKMQVSGLPRIFNIVFQILTPAGFELTRLEMYQNQINGNQLLDFNGNVVGIIGEKSFQITGYNGVRVHGNFNHIIMTISGNANSNGRNFQFQANLYRTGLDLE